MLESTNLIYFDITKTAGTHIMEILREVLDEDFLYRRKHVGPIDNINKFKLCSIRNPWDWYVSLWSFGCEGRGLLFLRLRQSHEHLYSDCLNFSNFREWLKLINESEMIESNIFKSRLYSRKAYKSIGIYTYRYLAAIHPDFRRNFSSDLGSYARILALHQDNDHINHYVRVHALESDLISGLEQAGVYLKENYRETIYGLSTTPTNTSRRSKIPFTEYYDEEAREVVHQREKLIIEQFGFSFDPKECITTKLDLIH